MAGLTLIKNPLAPFERERFELADGERPIDWLQRHYPRGVGGALRYFVNGAERSIDDLDYQPRAGDVIVLAVSPVEPISLTAILTSIAISAALTAASMVLSMLFAKPAAPAFANSGNNQPSPVYSVRGSQNTARLGECVPVPYGNVLHTPDLCSQPYIFFTGNTEEYLSMLLCIGFGDFTIQQILIGDSDADTIDLNAAQWFIVPPSVHLQRVGNIAALFDPPFEENMLTSTEVGGLEFIYPGDQAGYFRMGKSGQVGRYFWLDIEFPQGLYQLSAGGDTESTDVDWSVTIVEADGNGNPIAGTEQFFHFDQSGAGQSPLRVTYDFDAGHDASWLILLVRNTAQYPNNSKEMNRFQWTSLRMRVSMPPDQPVYGNTTLLAVRIHAGQISSTANNLIKVRLQRNLPPLGVGAPVASASPADAFCDIMTNPDYGARRPLAEVDVDRLAALKAFWAEGGGSYEFNVVYTANSTVWDALTASMHVVAATPLPLGNLMSVAQDGIKPARSIMFTEQNIAADSFALTYSWAAVGDHDGVEIEYRNPSTFAPAYAAWPAAASDPDTITLFGCTDDTHARQFARLQWQRRNGNRRAVSFDTELEGLIPILGERVALAHTMPRWGQSGHVIAVDGLAVTLDRNLLWDDPSLVPPYVIGFRDQYGGISNVVQCTRGPTDNVAVLAAYPWVGLSEGGFETEPTQELTHFAFGDGRQAVKDFVLTSLAPRQGKQVAVAGLYYDPAVYADTLAFLAFPVP